MNSKGNTVKRGDTQKSGSNISFEILRTNGAVIEYHEVFRPR